MPKIKINRHLNKIITAIGLFFLVLIVTPLILLNRHNQDFSFNKNADDLAIKESYQELLIPNNQKQIVTKDFSANKIPQFRIESSLSANELKKKISIINTWNGRQANIAFDVFEEGRDRVIRLAKNANFNPGAYKLKITDLYGQNLIQNFTWGVLALNLNKSSYQTNEPVEIFMTVLNNAGETECQADISLTIQSPSGQKYVLSSQNNDILKSDECQPKNFTYKPDFKTVFDQAKELGRYQIIFEATNKNGFRTIQDFILVENQPKFVISRSGPTRIFPPSAYKMEITLFSSEDFNGEVQEIIPGSFDLLDDKLTVRTAGNYKIISWPIKLIGGENQTITYEFKAPDVSPEFYLLGPLRLGSITKEPGLTGPIIFEEPRAWQIAADTVPSGIIVAWLSPTPPTGWTRDTTLDGYFLKGTAASTDPGTTGGASSHAHTVADHSHTHTAHSHSLTYGTSNPTTSNNNTTDYNNGANQAHIHAGSTSSSVINTEGNATTSLAAAANNSLPPYYDVLWIKSDGTAAIPANAVAYFNNATAPTGWSICNGTATTPDLRLFLRGAAAGVNPGGTGGTSTHTHTSDNHSHTQVAHAHTGTTGADDGGGTGNLGTSASTMCPKPHSHAVTLASNTAVQSAASFTIGAASNEPVNTTLVPIKNTSGAADQPSGIIAMWRGTLANIPAGWILCDGTGGTPDLRNQFIKGSNTPLSTGGANSHIHTAGAHTHTMTAHNHTGSTGYGNQGLKKIGTAEWPIDYRHTHAVTVANNSGGDLVSSVTVTVNSTDTQPPYYTVAYIQFQANAPSGCNVVESLVNNNLTLNWTYIEANEDSFQIYRNDNGAGFVSLGTAAANATSYLDNTTLSGHTYAYEVRAVYGATYSSWCVTPTYDTLSGYFRFEGVKMEGIKINLIKFIRRFLAELNILSYLSYLSYLGRRILT